MKTVGKYPFDNLFEIDSFLDEVKKFGKFHPKFTDYFLTPDGLVFSFKGGFNRFGRLKARKVSKYGYLCIKIDYSWLALHRLLAETFIPRHDSTLVVNHKDANKFNNNLNNLEWVSIRENVHHAMRLGLHPRPRKDLIMGGAA
jgi:hypothetical protein